MSYITKNIHKCDLLNRLDSIQYYNNLLRKEYDVYIKEHCPFTQFQIITIRDEDRCYNNYVGSQFKITRINMNINNKVIYWVIDGVVLKKNGEEMTHPVKKYQIVKCKEGNERNWMIKS